MQMLEESVWRELQDETRGLRTIDFVKHLLTLHDGEVRHVGKSWWALLAPWWAHHDPCLWHYQTVRAPWTHEWLYWRSRDPRREQKESVTMLLKPALRSRSASGGDGFGSSVHWARCRSWRPGFGRPSNVGADARAVVHTRPPQPVQGYASLAAYFAAGGGEAAGGLALKRRRPNKSRMQRRRRRRQ